MLAPTRQLLSVALGLALGACRPSHAAAGEPAPAAFRFVATVHTPQPPITERRGYHFVLAAEDPQSAVVYGCGINGELAVFDAGASDLKLLNNTVASDLMQSRAMLWYNKQLIVSAGRNCVRCTSCHTSHGAEQD